MPHRTEMSLEGVYLILLGLRATASDVIEGLGDLGEIAATEARRWQFVYDAADVFAAEIEAPDSRCNVDIDIDALDRVLMSLSIRYESILAEFAGLDEPLAEAA